MEYYSMSERILRSIENIIKNDYDIEDFTIIPTEDNTKNKSPVLYERGHLGLESWCIKYVYQYVCTELFKVRKNIADKKIGYLMRENLNYLLMGGLFINPDVTTFWNMRRELVEADVFSHEEELRLCKLILTRKPKSNEAFSYRRWILRRTLEKTSKTGVIPTVWVLVNEMQVALTAAANSPNNYHAWTHRIWCMENFSQYYPDIFSTELEFSEKWINEHVSENSGYHYRQFVINLAKNQKEIPNFSTYFISVTKQLSLLNDGEHSQLLFLLLGKPMKNKSLEDISKYINIITLLLHELLVVENINKVYKEHESLWLHRRYILFCLMQNAHEYLGETFCITKKCNFSCIGSNNATLSNKNFVDLVINENYGEKQPKIFKSQPSKFESSNLYRVLNNSEREFISKNSTGSALQVDLAKKYESWLNIILGLNIN